MIDKQVFYQAFKQTPELDFLLDKLGNSEVINRLSWIAYILATIKWETNDTFKPVSEGYWIKQNRLEKLYNYYQRNNPKAIQSIFPYGMCEPAYYGRGYVQITHYWNYDKFGIDRQNPDKALEPETAYMILEKGMTEGIFTGKKLSDYMNDSEINFYRARKIINGLDHAVYVSNLAERYYNALEWLEPERAISENGITVIVEEKPDNE